jgi:hypothetical protein
LYRRTPSFKVRLALITGFLLLAVADSFPADFNLPAAPLISLARGSNNTSVTYRGQTNCIYAIYGSTNAINWSGLTTNLCTNAVMTFSETNRPTRFYKATSFQTPLIYTCTNSGPDYGAFALFVRTNDTFALIGYTALVPGSTGGGEFSSSLSIGTNNRFSGNLLAGRPAAVNFAFNRITGTITNAAPKPVGNISGFLNTSAGPLQNAAGFYSGTFNGSCSGTLKAIVTADRTITMYIDDTVGGNDGGVATILSDNSFQVIGVKGSGPHYTGTVNPITRIISGSYIHGKCDPAGAFGAFTLTRQEKVFQ